tara:strand:- start:105 stop:512 length:408 start_codon:yes stop_codon:yes gene_type:complete
MNKNLLKGVLIILFPMTFLINQNTFAENQSEHKNKFKKDAITKEVNFNKENIPTLENKFNNDFANYQSFEDSTKPNNQFLNLFGIGGFADQRLKESSFKLWDTFEKELSNQIGTLRLSGSDINNTFNGSLKTLSK